LLLLLLWGQCLVPRTGCFDNARRQQHSQGLLGHSSLLLLLLLLLPHSYCQQQQLHSCQVLLQSLQNRLLAARTVQAVHLQNLYCHPGLLLTS
jgi:hypothetical protein